MELLTKKNIITSATLLAIFAVTTIGSIYAWRSYRAYAFKETFRRSYELGKTREDLEKNLLSSLKNKNKTDARAMYCTDLGGRSEEYKRQEDNMFEDFWSKVMQEDYSQSTSKSIQVGTSSYKNILIENIQQPNGKVTNREFATAGEIYREDKYVCSTPLSKATSQN
jgi:hypothetical protein